MVDWVFEGRPDSQWSYDLALDSFFDSRSSSTLLLLYSMSSSSYEDPFSRERCRYGDMGGYVCASYDELGITVPTSW